MEFINWLLIHPTGRMMAISTIFVLPISAATVGQPIIMELKMEEGNLQQNEDDPLLGVFEISGAGVSVLYCTEESPDKIRNAMIVTTNDERGRMTDIRNMSNEFKYSDIKKNVAGRYVESLKNNDQVNSFTGQISSETLQKGIPAVGFLLRQGSNIVKRIKEGQYRIAFKGKGYIVDSSRSKEGMHFKSMVLPSKSIQSHYYYYLGYETE